MQMEELFSAESKTPDSASAIDLSIAQGAGMMSDCLAGLGVASQRGTHEDSRHELYAAMLDEYEVCFGEKVPPALTPSHQPFASCSSLRR
ncbi:MAG: hypothetical protein ACI36V_03485 [Coriobacteriales bacterium]